ncbi:hypothetical protein RDV89_15025 [Nocardioides zeae]|uniref:Aminoglycoside phosphotransferase domain-containing protein n=1 Tax=Nocardioides imazamoxiresistens TaxID=3231893 RepID=A0ABU3PYP4_9ACTN|nr:hypothetical protein [Nocardioides zeae]MDT9594395.1 hypothetical protein [Nocardioides zeae]
MTRDRTWSDVAGVVWPAAHGGGCAIEAVGSPAVAGGEAYELVRFAGRVRYVVSDALSPRARRRVLLYGNRLRAPARRLARSAVASSYLLRRPRPAARVVAEADLLHLRGRVARSLRRPEAEVHLTFAVLERDGAPRPTVLAVDRHGTPLLFLKLGAGPARAAALARERDALDRATRAVPAAVQVPRRRLWLRSGDVTVLGTEPLRPDVAPVSSADPDATWPALDALVAANPRCDLALAASPWLVRLQRVAEDLRDGPHRDLSLVADAERLRRLVVGYRARHGAEVLAHGLRHGDWSSWNLGWAPAWQGRRLTVWDWEYGEQWAPLSLDRHNWFYARATSVRGQAAADAAADLLAEARPQRRGEVATGPLTTRLFLLDMAARRLALAAAGEVGSGRAADELLRVLADDLG